MATDPFKAALSSYRSSQKTPRASSKSWYSSTSRKTRPVHYGKHKTHPVVSPKTSKQDHGILDNILSVTKNLGSDVVDTVEGIPGGIVQTIHHPVGTAQAIGHDYRNRYGPLFGYLKGEGDIGKFASNLKEHPLAPILDVASVATLGGGAAAKVGQAGRISKALSHVDSVGGEAGAAARLKIATKAPMRTKLYDATKGGYREIGVSRKGAKGVKVPLQNNPIKRLRRNLGISFQEKVLPVNTPIIGLKSRALKGAANQKLERAGDVRYHQRQVTAAVDAMEKLAGGDKTKLDSMANAADYLVSGVDPLKHAETIKKTRLDPLHHKKMEEAGHTPEEIQAAMDHALRPAMDKHTRDLFEAANRRYQLDHIERTGGKISTPFIRKEAHALVDSPEVRAIMKVRDAHDAAADHAMTQMVKAGKLTADEVSQRRVLHVTTVELLGREAVPAARSAQISKVTASDPIQKARQMAARDAGKARNEAEAARVEKASVPLTPEEVDRAFDKAGLPRPVYNPDTISVGSAKATKHGDSGDYASGDRIVAPMNIVMRHEWASKITDAQHAHSLLTSLGTYFEHELPNNNWVWVRDDMPKTIEYTRDLGKSQSEMGVAASQEFYKQLRDEVRPKSGLAVPRQVFEEMTVGRAAMTAARHGALSKALNIWKWATLATRPGFLTVNVLSNQLMYHLKNGWDFRAFRNARTAAGAFDEHHSVAGATWGDSERGLSQGGKLKKLKAARDIMYILTGKHEHALRKFTMYETARKLPQVQREIKALKGGKYDPAAHGGRTMFHEAYNRAIQKSPHIRDMVTKNMDDTLGNYRYYTQTEQVLKNISPFYGWERHSVRNFLRMAEDNPAQMAMLTAVGAQGDKKFMRDFGKGMPDFVHTYVMDNYFKTIAKHLGMGDDVTAYDFGGINPWKTSVDVGKAVFKGDKKSLLGLSGPAVTGPLEEITGKNVLTGAPATKTHFSNSILSTIERVIHQTPPVTFTENLATDKYKKAKMLKKTKGQVIGQYLGGSFKSPDLERLRDSQARTEAAESGKPTHRKRKYKKYKSTAKGFYG